MFKIEVKPFYSVTFRGKRAFENSRLTHHARSLKAVVNRLAWWMIFDKYGDVWELPVNAFIDIEPQVKTRNPPGILCECTEDNSDDFGPIGPEWEYCPLHNRDDGYFARVHSRLVRWILSMMGVNDNRRKLAGDTVVVVSVA